MKRQVFYRLILAVAGGSLLALTFPDVFLWPLAWIALIPLIYCLKNIDESGKVFFFAFIYSLSGFLISLAWVRRTMIDYGGLPVYLSVFFLFLLSVYCALFPAAAVTIAKTGSGRTGIPFLILLPLTWVAFEYFRTHVFTGFPWNSIGMSQYAFEWLLQNADWGSFYALSFGIVAGNCFLYSIFLEPRNRQRRYISFINGVILTGMLGYGWFRCNQPEPVGSVRVGIVQGNTDQHVKWTQKYTESILRHHLDLSESIVDKSPALIIWPESAITFNYRFGYRYSTEDGKTLGGMVHNFVSNTGIPLIMGTLDQVNQHIYNSAVLVPPLGLESYYYKEHLVPFGEYVPLKHLFFFVNRMVDDSIGNFSTGKNPDPLHIKDAAVGITICYENIFPSLVRDRVLAGAEVICNLTNDTWFGRSSAAAQHFSSSCLRAVETRRPVIRAANSGYSGAVDQRGRILYRSHLFTSEAVVIDIMPSKASTFFVRFGDVFAIACSIMTAVLMISVFIRTRNDTDR